MSTLDQRVSHIIDWINYVDHGLLNKPVIEIPDCGRDDLAHVFARLSFAYGIEVGTERGLYAEMLCEANPDVTLFCVDPYKAYRGYREYKSQRKLETFFTEAVKRLAPYNVIFIRKFSVEAVTEFEDRSLDFVYIDGNHSLLHVIQDLWHWTPKVRKGGIVAGHDYIRRVNKSYAMHVVPAIHAYCDAFLIKPLFLLGTKAMIEGEVRDTPRSWFFIKE